MFKRIFAVLTALVMLVAAAGVSLAETAVTEKTAGLTIEDIKALNGGPVTVHTDSGRITFVGGTCTDKPVKSHEDAQTVIDAMLPLLGGDGRTAFEPWRVLSDPAGNVYYVFQQVLEDALVPGGAVKVITDRDGNMTGLTGSIVPVLVEGKDETKERLSITAEEAETLVLRHEQENGRAKPDVIHGKTVKIVLPVDRVVSGRFTRPTRQPVYPEQICPTWPTM